MNDLDHDFRSDLDSQVKSFLKAFKIKFSEKPKDSLLIDFLTIQKKLVSTFPREVFVSPILQDKILECSYKYEIENIISLLETGVNVNFFQSEDLFQTRKHDYLVYEWNIHHFHLSLNKIKNSSFYGRTKTVLFAYITDDKAILLDIKDHNRRSKSFFGDSYWIKILHDYFPSEISKFKHEFDLPMHGEGYSPEERLKMWENGLTSLVYKIGNVSYHAPGVGISTSGHSIMVVMQAQSIIRWVHYATNFFSESENEIKRILRRKVWNLEMAYTEHGFAIVDHKAEEVLLIYPQIYDA